MAEAGLAMAIPGDAESLRSAVREVLTVGGGEVYVPDGDYNMAAYSRTNGPDGLFQALGLTMNGSFVVYSHDGGGVIFHQGLLLNLRLVVIVLPGRETWRPGRESWRSREGNASG